MASQHTTEEIVENFLDILRGEYKHAKSTRGEQFAEWNHFSDQFLKKSTDVQLLDVFFKTFLQIKPNEVNNFTSWINRLILAKVPYKKLVFDILNSDCLEEKKFYMARWFINRLEIIPHEADLIKLTDDEKNLLKPYGYKP